MSGKSPQDWEEHLDELLRKNNDRLMERIVHALHSVETSQNWTPALGAKIEPSELEATSQKCPSSPCSGPVDSWAYLRTARGTFADGRRVSMTSFDTAEEQEHRDILRQSQAAQRAETPRRSQRSWERSRNTFLRQNRRNVGSWTFEAIFAALILTNSIFIGVEVHYSAHSPGQLPVAFFIIDQVYAGLFLIELVMRILAEGFSFFWSSKNLAWNYLDIAINFTSILNLASAIAVADAGADSFKASGNVRIIRILRLTRVIRVVRIVKIVRFIRALRSLVHSIFGTLKVLAWSVLLLVLIMYVFAIVFTDVANAYATGIEDEVNEVALEFIRTHFFDLEKSIMTLFQSISNGLNWGDVANALNQLSHVWGYLYVAYVAFCLFAVLNVMTGMFCQSAIESAERDQELQVQTVLNSKQQQVEMFMTIFDMLLRDGDRGLSSLTFADFEQLFAQPHIRSFFQALDVEPRDAWTLFKLMDVQGQGNLDASEFVEGCMRLKGPARAIDMSLLLQEQRRSRKKLLTVEQLLLDLMQSRRSRKSSSDYLSM